MIGPFVGLAFGLLWFLAGASVLPGRAAMAMASAGVLLFAAGAWAVARRRRTRAGYFRWPRYAIAVAAEVAGIIAAQNIPALAGRLDLLLTVIGTVVGLHFIGLKLATGLNRFLALSAAMVLINLAALLLPLGGRGRTMLSGFGSGAALFVSAVA